MALKSCTKCGRKFSDERKRCPYCGARGAEPVEGGGSSRGRRNALVLALVFVLIVINVSAAATRVRGPPPELEALHSSEEAIRQCREGIESRLSDRGGTVQGSLEAEYLQGGDYVVDGVVSVVEGRRRVTRPVLCEAQFRPEGGWKIEHVEVGS